MKSSRFKHTPWSRIWSRRFVVAVTIALVLIVIPVVVLATHTATVTNAPTSASPSTSTSFTLRVTNDVGSQHAIKEVVLVVDASFTSVATGTPPTSWTSGVVGNTITWSTGTASARIAAGTFKDFPWSATTGSAGTVSHSWTTTDQANGTATGTVTTVVGASDFYAAPGAVVLAGVVYLLWRRRVARRLALARS